MTEDMEKRVEEIRKEYNAIHDLSWETLKFFPFVELGELRFKAHGNYQTIVFPRNKNRGSGND